MGKPANTGTTEDARD